MWPVGRERRGLLGEPLGNYEKFCLTDHMQLAPLACARRDRPGVPDGPWWARFVVCLHDLGLLIIMSEY